ncbi:hypothetical protein M8C21_006940, partial [Ambrosia artemisiifolia]
MKERMLMFSLARGIFSKEFALILLVVHLGLLLIFVQYRWCKHEGGLVSFLRSRFVEMQLKTSITGSFPFKKSHSSSSRTKIIKKEDIVITMFTG